jgi:hypothetical protein
MYVTLFSLCRPRHCSLSQITGNRDPEVNLQLLLSENINVRLLLQEQQSLSLKLNSFYEEFT